MASRRRQRRKECKGKRRYATYAEAQPAARGASRRSDSTIWAYPCRWCGGWHIGHPPRRIKQGVAAKLAQKGT